MTRDVPGQGRSVALSSDGNTALVGGQFGAMIWSRSGNGWIQKGGTSLSDGTPEICLGYSAALSGDGRIAVLGCPCDGPSGPYSKVRRWSSAFQMSQTP